MCVDDIRRCRRHQSTLDVESSGITGARGDVRRKRPGEQIGDVRLHQHRPTCQSQVHVGQADSANPHHSAIRVLRQLTGQDRDKSVGVLRLVSHDAQQFSGRQMQVDALE
eukprot:gene28017-biopygen23823